MSPKGLQVGLVCRVDIVSQGVADSSPALSVSLGNGGVRRRVGRVDPKELAGPVLTEGDVTHLARSLAEPRAQRRAERSRIECGAGRRSGESARWSDAICTRIVPGPHM